MFFQCCSPVSIPAALSGRVALVTGASAGLGQEFARQLAPHVRKLILVARRMDRMEQIRDEIARPGLEVQCQAVDLSDRASVEAFLRTLATGPAVDLLINNAGLGDHGYFDTSEWSRVEAMLEVNVRALTRLTHALLPGLLSSGRGRILNVSSVAALAPVPQLAVYAASKAYVTSFSEALRAELRGSSVTVTVLCPGPVTTEFSQVAARPGEVDEMQSPEFIRVPPWQVVHEAISGLVADRARVVPGWTIWVVALALSVIPFALLRPLLSLKTPAAEALIEPCAFRLPISPLS